MLRPRQVFSAVRAVAFLGIVALACDPPDPTRGHMDCPNKPGTTQVLTGRMESPISDIPEYHDCQQFIDPTTGQYHGLYGTFATFRLDTLFANVPTVSDLSQVHILGGVVVRPRANVSPDGPIPASANPWVATTTPGPKFINVATIVSYQFDYDPLGILVGANCLFLSFHDGMWHGIMNFNNNNANCPRVLNAPPSAYTVLAVRSLAPAFGLEAADVPPSTRFDRDSITNQYYIGVRCGGEWCEVGAPGFTPSKPIPVPDLNVAYGWNVGNNRRVFMFKGWYDRQTLGILSGGILSPTGPTGVIIPHPELKGRSVSNYQTGEWQDMAYIFIDSNAYQGKLNLTTAILQPNALVTPNVFRARMERNPKWTQGPNEPEWIWRAQIENSKGLKIEQDMTYIDHAGDGLVDLIYMARFRWVANDEEGWIGCLTGCCSTCETPTCT